MDDFNMKFSILEYTEDTTNTTLCSEKKHPLTVSFIPP